MTAICEKVIRCDGHMIDKGSHINVKLKNDPISYRGKIGNIDETGFVLNIALGAAKRIEFAQIDIMDADFRMISSLEIDANNIRCSFEPELHSAIKVVRNELLKRSDLYDGFMASIASALRESGVEKLVIEDMSRRILDRVVGGEEQDGGN